MEGWRECTLGDCLIFGNGKARPSSNGSIPVYGGNGILDYCDEWNYSGETIVVGRVGAYCGSVFFPSENIWISDNALSVKVKKEFFALFFYYFLKHINLNSYAEGSSHPLLTQTLLKSIPVAIPNFPQQQAIAAVLSSLDDKIDLLHRQSKTLEALAQTLFRQWFVEEADDSFNEVTLRELCLKIESGGTPKRDVAEFWEGEIPWLTSGEVRTPFILDTKETITSDGLSNSTAKIWNKGTVIVAMYGATAGIVCYTMIPLSANQACCGLKPKTEYEAFVYFYLTRYSETMAEQATGSAQQNLNKGMIENLSLFIAEANTMQKFQNIAGKLLNVMGENVKQVRTLTKLRDTLLPKLMSGEVRVEV